MVHKTLGEIENSIEDFRSLEELRERTTDEKVSLKGN